MTDLNTADARLVVPAARTLTEDQSIRPFRVTIPEKELVELRRRIAAAHWPTKELVEDRSQGVQLATLRELTRYWTTEYDWRKVETRLNALPQFTTKIDGVEIHFAVLADAHRRLGRPVVLGVRTGSGRSPCGRQGSSGGLGSRRLHDVPRRDLGCPAQLG